MSRRILPTIVLAMLFLSTITGRVAADVNEKYNDPDTPKIRASFTVAPDTDDIKELRAFIMHCRENWSSGMMQRYKDYDDYELFLYEMSQARLDAAGKILAILHEQGREENTNVDDNDAARYDFRYGARSEDNDTMFAVKVQVESWRGLSTLGPLSQIQETAPVQLERFEKFVESLERDPKRRDLGMFARESWFCAKFQFTRHSLGPQDLAHYNKTFEQLKQYLATNADNPLLKFFVTSLFFTQKKCAEEIESFAATTAKKGSLVVPLFEYYDTIFRSWDEDLSKQFYISNWADYYEGEMVKYRILVADDQPAAFREAVGTLKESLEQGLDKDSIQKVFGLHRIAYDLEQRVEMQRLLYQTVHPVFAASSDPEVNHYVKVFDMYLEQFALVGEELEFEAVLLDGTKIDLKDFRGKVVLLDYWATWCGPCIGEFPAMKAAYKTYHDKGFEIIALSVDEDLDALKAMIEKEELPWLNASEILSQEQNLPDSRELDFCQN